MKVLETKTISIPEAKKILVEREKDGELVYEQKLALEHLKKHAKLKEEDAQKMTAELSSIIRMNPDVLAQVVNILPQSTDELRAIFARERFSLKEEEVNKILEIIKKYA